MTQYKYFVLYTALIVALFLSVIVLINLSNGEQNKLAFTNAVNKFALEFYEQTASLNPDKSMIMSPLSTEIILAMLSQGAEGLTRNEIISSLHLSDFNTMKSSFKSLLNKLKKSKSNSIKLANKIYVNSGDSYRLDPNFKKIAHDVFGSDVENVDFSSSENAAHTINNWVESKTNNKIKQLISSNQLDAMTKLVLVNTIYFKGEWESAFKEYETTKYNFSLNNKQDVEVDMMSQRSSFLFSESSELDSKILKLPYTNSNMSMVIILPNKVNGLKDLEKKIPNIELLNVLNKMYDVEVAVTIPKFKIETTIDLSKMLPELGISRIFDDQKSNMIHILKNKGKLFVTDAVQKAFIEVNEKGTEAAAATDFGMGLISLRDEVKYFSANHPFFFMLMNHNDIVLCGRYIGK